ncbi:MAG TPA: LuxR C-terminal-related transcriptional regulator [Thermomicrobiales bacterium]|nr:LuxR C-terminal-related transcriptional regulator [Thermomicrobiales bacterium]
MTRATPADRSSSPPAEVIHLVPPQDAWARLPRFLTPFVGREREIRTLQSLLRCPDVRLLTLTGPGGVGKTRLAVRVAEEVAGAFAHRTAFVSLASLHDPDLMYPQIAAVLGVRQGLERSLVDRLVACLGGDPFLLLLDNLEQVPSAARHIAELLVACPQLTVLATSRASLHVSGERTFAVPPLALPTTGARTSESLTLNDLARADAVRLFVERAQAARADFALTEANVEAVVAICRKLDGLPLAIELAAARLGTLPPASLLTRLQHQLPLLVGGPQDAPPRLQTMRDAIGWSYGLLSEEEQRLFRRLSTFASGFTLEAAEQVGGLCAPSLPTTLDGIASLVDKSLVRQVEEPGSEPRYAMLEVIREFGLERLAASGEMAASYDRLLSWYLSQAQPAGWRWGVPMNQTDAAWFAGWERELTTVRSLLAWMETEGDIERGLQLASALFLFWWARDHLPEGRGWLERGLAAGPRVSPGTRALALSVLSAIAHRQDDNAWSANHAREALSLFTRIDDEEGAGHASYLLGIALYRQGDLLAAERCYEQAITLLRPTQKDATLENVIAAEARLGIAQIARDRGDLVRAASVYDQTLQWQTLAGVTWGAALSRYGYGTVTQALGDVPRALALYRESMHYWRQIGDDGSVAVCLEGIASALCAAGVPAQAARFLGVAQALREAVDAPVPCNALAAYGGLARSVRDSLGETAFNEAWLAGHRLSGDEAIAEASRSISALVHPDRPAPTTGAPPCPSLTRREREVLKLVATGHADREIAAALFISRRTASEHVSRILQKLGARSRTDAAALAVRFGLA